MSVSRDAAVVPRYRYIFPLLFLTPFFSPFFISLSSLLFSSSFPRFARSLFLPPSLPSLSPSLTSPFLPPHPHSLSPLNRPPFLLPTFLPLSPFSLSPPPSPSSPALPLPLPLSLPPSPSTGFLLEDSAVDSAHVLPLLQLVLRSVLPPDIVKRGKPSIPYIPSTPYPSLLYCTLPFPSLTASLRSLLPFFLSYPTIFPFFSYTLFLSFLQFIVFSTSTTFLVFFCSFYTTLRLSEPFFPLNFPFFSLL